MHIQLTDKDKRQKVKPIIHTIKTRSCDVFTYSYFVSIQFFDRENLKYNSGYKEEISQCRN